MLLLFQLLAKLPLPWLHFLGSLLGGLMWLLSPRARRLSRENLALAFPAGVPAGVAWQSAKAAGQGFAELPWLWLRSIEETTARVTRVEGWDAVEAAKARGDALLFLTPHIGCFEMVGQVIGTRLPITCLYRPPKNPKFQPLFDAGRNRGQMQIAAANTAGVRKIIKALRQKAAVGILPDQVPQHGEGVWAPFFGRPAYTMTLAARLAQIPGVSTFFVYATREGHGHYHFFVQPTVLHSDAAVGEAADLVRISAINREIERIVLQRPEQYFWSYNRYKSPHAEAQAKRDKAVGQDGGAE